MNSPNTNQNFRQRRSNNYKKGGGGGGRQDFRRGSNNGGGHSYNAGQGSSNQARHPELDIAIDARAAKRASMMRDKYQSMARDAQSSGDRVYGEYCLQHVEHYNRILNAFNESRPQHLRTPEANEGGDDAQSENTGEATAATPQASAHVVTLPPAPDDESYQAASAN